MRVVHVHVQVKPGDVEAFKAATIENASQSVKEAGVARFDVIQDADDPTRFVLVEIYRTPEAPAAHKATAHYRDMARHRRRHDGRAADEPTFSLVFPALTRFEFATATRVVFGAGAANDIGALVRRFRPARARRLRPFARTRRARDLLARSRRSHDLTRGRRR